MKMKAHLANKTKIASLTILTKGVAVWAARADHRPDEFAKGREKLATLEEELKSKTPEQTRRVNEKKHTQLLERFWET